MYTFNSSSFQPYSQHSTFENLHAFPCILDIDSYNYLAVEASGQIHCCYIPSFQQKKYFYQADTKIETIVMWSKKGLASHKSSLESCERKLATFKNAFIASNLFQDGIKWQAYVLFTNFYKGFEFQNIEVEDCVNLKGNKGNTCNISSIKTSTE